MFKRVISTSFVFIGAIVGAGFATGKEICVYFGSASIWAPILAGLFLGLFCLVFMLLGRGSEDVLVSMFGDCSYAARVVVVLSNFVVFAAMIAGAELIFRECFRQQGIGIVSAIAAIFFVGRGGRALSFINTLLVPVIIGVLIYFLTIKEGVDAAGKGLFLQPLAYASMNVLTGGYLVSGYAKHASKKECLLTGAIVAIVSSVLLVGVYLVATDYAETPMPLFTYAQDVGVTIGAGLMIFSAIFTTMTTSLQVVSGGCTSIAVVATIAALVVSLVGFSPIVTYAYPVIGYVGIAFSGYAVIHLLKTTVKRWRKLKVQSEK